MPAPLQKFLIAPLKSGQQNNVKPWLIANDAYESLRNAYTWRGRVKKRVGGRVMDQSKPIPLQQQFTRLRLNVGTTDDFGDRFLFVPGTAAGAIGQMFSIGDDYFTVNALGNPAPLLSTNPAAAGTFDTTTLVYNFINATPLTIIYFYPATPVMALQLYNQIQINNEITIAFDRNYSYQYAVGTGWNRSGAATFGSWTGSDSQFHWTTNWRGAESSDYLMFVVNNNPPDGIQYFNGTDWFVMPPPVINNVGDTLLTSLMVVPFKDRLLFLGPTFQIGLAQTTYANAILFSQAGSPFDVDAFNTDIKPKGIFLVAPTKESIISCEFLKDRLIIFFENSTWELVFTNNTAFPYVFQKINTELGVESTHSIIPFDKVAIGMGSTGIHACTGINVQRIDDLIPSTIFDISNINAGPQRVYGIRDYYEELCYWSYPSGQEDYVANDTFPNRVLVYDYVNNTWAFNDDSITAFGYFYLQDNLLIWQNITSTWREMTQEWQDFESDQLFRSVIAGNQEGWTFIVQPDLESNCMALQITDMTTTVDDVTFTVIDHNIIPNSWVFVANIVDDTGNLETLNNTIQQAVYVDDDHIRFIVPGLAGTYSGGGTLERVSQIKILTKQYNLFPEAGMATFFPYIDFLVSRTMAGAITVDYYIETSQQSMISDGTNSGAILGTNILQTSPYVLRPFEQMQDEFWHRVNFGTYGNFVQLNIYFYPEQMVDQNIVFSEFTLNAFLIYAKAENNYF